MDRETRIKQVNKKSPYGCPFEVGRGRSRHKCVCGCTRLNYVGLTGRGRDLYQCDDCGHKFSV